MNIRYPLYEGVYRILTFVQWYTWFLVFLFPVLPHISYPLVPTVVLNSYTALSSLSTGPCTVAVVSSG